MISSKKTIYDLKRLILYFIIALLNSEAIAESLLKKDHKLCKYAHFMVKDTLYTYSNYIIEVNLNEQIIYVHRKDGQIFKFSCSTGNPDLEKGISTPEGIFVIKNKAKKVYSTQFDSTLMLNWMGFNLNIGFHALQGKSYYKFLGKRVSSHGCIRVSHETSEFFFNYIPIGTPVIIHSGTSARIIEFAKEGELYKYVNSSELRKLSKENLKYLYNGLYLNKHYKLLISNNNVTHRGLEIGDETQISFQLPQYQKPASYHLGRKLFEVID